MDLFRHAVPPTLTCNKMHDKPVTCQWDMRHTFPRTTCLMVRCGLVVAALVVVVAGVLLVPFHQRLLFKMATFFPMQQ